MIYCRTFRLSDYYYFVSAAVGKVEAMPCSFLTLLRNRDCAVLIFVMTFIFFAIVAFLGEIREEFL